jgi:polysaccharide export outer membrane protein
MTSWALASAQPLPLDRLAEQSPIAQPYSEPEMAWRTFTYILGPDDEIRIHVTNDEESRPEPIRIGLDGTINLPLLGRVRGAGLTVTQLEADLNQRLKPYFRDPAVAVSVTEFRSQPVSIVGAVRSPGIYQVQGHKTLVEMISLAGGTREDSGYTIRITRRLEWGQIQLPSTEDSEDGKFSVAEVELTDVMGGKNPELNIQIMPHDVISIPRAELVYVIGAVERSGGFVLGERENMSVLQALALAGGLGRSAAPKKARILRPVKDTAERTEIGVDVKSIMTGKSSDVFLLRDDILFVPESGAKNIARAAATAALGIGTSIAIYSAR